jgi:hypothetical protein
MASPTYNDVWTYAHTLQGVSQQARDAFLVAAAEVDFSDWAEAAEQLRQIAMAVTDAYGLAAGELGAQWYEYCRAMKYGSGYRAIVGTTSRYGIKSDCDTVIDKLFKGTITEDALIGALAGVVVDHIQTRARDVIEDNLDIEYKAARASGNDRFADEIGYARVPNAGACAFCIMLASRGFVYRSEYTATTSKRTGDRYHEHCTCTAVPFHQAGTIKGYGKKLAQYEDTYLDARSMWKSGNMPDELKQRIDTARAEHAQKVADGQAWDKWSDDNEITIVMRWQNPGMH